MDTTTRSALRLLLVLAAVSLCSVEAAARPGFYVGAGYAGVSASGDLDGTQILIGSTTTEGTGVDILGKLGSGSGTVINIGYGFNRYIDLEYLSLNTYRHAATSDRLSPPLETTAKVETGIVALRFTVPVAESFEIFARYGAAASAITYADYSVRGSVVGSQVTPNKTGSLILKGSRGSVVGAGFEIIGEHIGVQLAYNVINIYFDETDGSYTDTGKLPVSQNETFTATTAAIFYHF